MTPGRLSPHAASKLLSQLWRRHQVCFLSYTVGVQPHRVLLPCTAHLPALQSPTTPDSPGVCGSRPASPAAAPPAPAAFALRGSVRAIQAAFSLRSRSAGGAVRGDRDSVHRVSAGARPGEHGPAACGGEGSPGSLMRGELVFASFQLLFLPRGF